MYVHLQKNKKSREKGKTTNVVNYERFRLSNGPKIMTAKGVLECSYVACLGEERDKSLLDFMGMNKNAGKSPLPPFLPEVLTQPNFE